MKTYARIEGGVVMELINPAVDSQGQEIDINIRFVPDLVATFVDITSISPQPQENWTYENGSFQKT